MSQGHTSDRSSSSAGFRLRRRTLTTSAAWATPVAVVATASPSFAATLPPPVVNATLLNWCKYPGASAGPACKKAYQLTYRITTDLPVGSVLTLTANETYTKANRQTITHSLDSVQIVVTGPTADYVVLLTGSTNSGNTAATVNWTLCGTNAEGDTTCVSDTFQDDNSHPCTTTCAP